MPATQFEIPDHFHYLTGFGTYHESEAVKGALPVAQNTPQKVPFGLYTERISGTAFIADRAENGQTWIYRRLPSAKHGPFAPLTSHSGEAISPTVDQRLIYSPTQVRWSPFDFDDQADWTTSMRLLSQAGSAVTKTGLSYYIYTAGRSMMPHDAFYSTDGDLLIIPQHGSLHIRTELGHIFLRPQEICVIPRGIRYNVTLPQGNVRGYALELHNGHFTLPKLGPLGSFGLANARDFQIPTASFDTAPAYENTATIQPPTYHIITKFNNQLFVAHQSHSPFDVVAWHGTWYPYKYDLGRFLTIGSVSYDHLDPSIFTVLTSTSGAADFAIFPPRWIVMENTFRPPWFHRNTMTEFMGLIKGEYDARTDGGFQPGGASLHNVMAAHGPDSSTHTKASNLDLVPEKVGVDSLAFIIESNMLLGLTPWAWEGCGKRQLDYNFTTWGGFEDKFEIYSKTTLNERPGTDSRSDSSSISTAVGVSGVQLRPKIGSPKPDIDSPEVEAAMYECVPVRASVF